MKANEFKEQVYKEYEDYMCKGEVHKPTWCKKINDIYKNNSSIYSSEDLIQECIMRID